MHNEENSGFSVHPKNQRSLWQKTKSKRIRRISHLSRNGFCTEGITSIRPLIGIFLVILFSYKIRKNIFLVFCWWWRWWWYFYSILLIMLLFNLRCFCYFHYNFNCVYFSWGHHKYFHKWTRCGVFLSALLHRWLRHYRTMVRLMRMTRTKMMMIMMMEVVVVVPSVC